jgi:hypothetical protein
MLRADNKKADRLPEIEALVEDAQEIAEKEALVSPDDFWAKIAVTDAKLVGYLHENLRGKQGTFTENIRDGLVREYEDAWRQYGSARELNSIIEHYTFLVATIRSSDAHKDLCNALEKILNSLRSMSEQGD